jgi:hypothetical protein
MARSSGPKCSLRQTDDNPWRPTRRAKEHYSVGANVRFVNFVIGSFRDQNPLDTSPANCTLEVVRKTCYYSLHEASAWNYTID